MRVTTSIVIEKPVAAVWPLLCSSKMDGDMPCLFRLGIPKPVECKLPDGIGGFGASRECISDRGVIHQRITHWQENQMLRFQMEDTNLYFRPCVTAIIEEFCLEAVSQYSTRLTRTTDIRASGGCRILKEWIMCAGMKRVHRFVFSNWSRAGIQKSAIPHCAF